ncbi:DNA cross-link repair 1A protein [Wickerhamomyces ciferrii]|uniref:DNA cross-link repair 1A protein n=1 Tax=Wickerhamomyces ciferrii (strain ATCC 14091 / BCRC 22168 / CBS 111 / JCM 3599 / NBRC 0793 / NRRL Y-1031 F-60-10) TaxID=1206466 RepID=K0KF21_WICCF|nr:DNA cross-link repair 1A protein [Wickerhamomyces ciferrii]CCH40802.1 DNA cross-link repair 1A protein [Wickerhamomyces ciferrii]
MVDILDLFKKRKLNHVKNEVQINEVIDLTSDEIDGDEGIKEEGIKNTKKEGQGDDDGIKDEELKDDGQNKVADDLGDLGDADIEIATDIATDINLNDPDLISQQYNILKTMKQDLSCPICSLNIENLSISNRESHVEACISIPKSTPKVIKTKPKSPSKTTKTTKSKPKGGKPRVPRQSKPIPDFKILTFNNNYKLNVDGFQFQDHPSIDKYFLSHYHSDHYIGLSKKWSQGIIYTSKTTSNLLQSIMKIPSERIIGLEFGIPHDLTEQIKVTLFDANHCPGGAIFLFEEYNPKGEIIKRILHTGDFRVSKQHLDLFKDMFLDEIYLDTTYMNPVYTFMLQSLVIKQTCEFLESIINNTITKNSILNYFTQNQDYLILIGSYSIGKEKLYIQLAKTINSKILITKERYKFLSCIENFNLDIFTTDPKDPSAKIQIISIQKLSDNKFLSQFSSKKIIKIKPTGWSFNTFKTLTASIKNKTPQEILNQVLTPTTPSTDYKTQLLKQFQNSSSLSVPYSEHSSFKELSILGCFLKWGEIIPTVNTTNPTFQEWFNLWKDKKIDEGYINDYYKTT